MKVTPVLNEYGKVVSDQYVFDCNGYRYFQSYDDIIAKVDQSNGAIFLDENHYDNSKTTAKYRNMFLNLSTSKLRNGITDGLIRLVDLNGDNDD